MVPGDYVITVSAADASGSYNVGAATFNLKVAHPDTDGDGVLDDVDNCPLVANANQADTDGDGRWNVCDSTPNGPDPDSDGDGVVDSVDNCDAVVNPSQADADGDEPATHAIPRRTVTLSSTRTPTAMASKTRWTIVTRSPTPARRT